MRSCTVNVREHLISSYGRSLLIYFATLLVAAGIWKEVEVTQIEKQIYREALLLPKDISGQLILNVA